MQATLLGAITAIGGGMLRDVLLRDVPTVLRHELYAIPALLGAGVLVAAQTAGSDNPVFPVLGVAVGVVVRLVGLRYKLNVPSAPGPGHGIRRASDGGSPKVPRRRRHLPRSRRRES